MLHPDSKALGSPRQRTQDPESFERGAAKQTLTAWMDDHSEEKERHLALRREIAERCDLDELARRCGAFDAFRRALRPVAL